MRTRLSEAPKPCRVDVPVAMESRAIALLACCVIVGKILVSVPIADAAGGGSLVNIEDNSLSSASLDGTLKHRHLLHDDNDGDVEDGADRRRKLMDFDDDDGGAMGPFPMVESDDDGDDDDDESVIFVLSGGDGDRPRRPKRKDRGAMAPSSSG